MKPIKEENIPLLNFISNLIIIFLLIIALGYAILVKEYRYFEIKSKNIEYELLKEYERRLKTEVERVADYIDYYKSLTESRLKKEIKNRVYQADAIASFLYQKYAHDRSLSSVKDLIKDALYPIRWREGYSYIWIVDTAGKAVMFPINPAIENSDVSDYRDAHGRYILKEAIELALKNKEGYITKIYVKPKGASKKELQQIAFIKLFEPFGWIIGTGETIDDIEKEIKGEILKRIKNIRFNSEGYFAIIENDSTVLYHPFIKSGTKMAQENERLREISEKIINAAKNGGGFVIYNYRKLSEEKEARKLTYVKPINEWGWIVFAGIYLDELENLIEAKKIDLERELYHKIKLILIIFGSFTIMALALSLLFSKKLTKVFNNYKKKIEYRTQRLEKLNKELKLKEKQAQAASNAKSMFISNISHDIRTPLNAILGYAQLLNKDDGLNGIQKEKVTKILKHGSYLLELLDEIIEISKIETDNIDLNIENFDLKSFLENIEDIFSEKALDKGLKWSVEGIPEKECFLMGDKKKLFRVLINIVSNAFKYTDFGEIKLLVEPLGDSKYRFSVIDTGIGIDKEDQKEIFKVFTQARAGQERGGKGLGLSIAYRFINLMGGELKLISEPKKGSVFYFEIELKPSINIKQELKKEGERKTEKRSQPPDYPKLDPTTKRNLLELAKIGNISKLKKEIQKLRDKKAKSYLMEYLNRFDLEGLQKALEKM